MANASKIALSIGSKNTSIFKQGEGIVLSEPSAVVLSVGPKSKSAKVAGVKAKRLLGRTDKGTNVVFPIFRGAVIDNDAATEMLKVFLSKIFVKKIKKPSIKAIMCVPIGLSAQEAKNLERVCLAAGISQVSLIPSVVCGAFGLSLPVVGSGALFVLSIGGGTTDIAVLCNGSIIRGISLGIGSSDLDLAIENAIAHETRLSVAEGVSEKVKIEIASLYSNDMSATEVSGIDEPSGQTRTEIIKSNQLFSVVEEFFQKIALAAKEIIGLCTPEIVADIANDGLHVFGSGSQVPGLAEFFCKQLGIPVSIDESASYVEIVGAGKLLSDKKNMLLLKSNI